MTSHQEIQAPDAGRDGRAEADYRPVPVGAAPRGPAPERARRRRLVRASIAVLALAGIGLGWASVELPSELQLVRPLRAMLSGSDAGARAGAALPLDLHAWKDRTENAQRESAARIEALTAQLEAMKPELDARAGVAARLDQLVARLDRVEQSGLRGAARREAEPQPGAGAPPAPKPPVRTAEASHPSPAESAPREASAPSQRRAETAQAAPDDGNIFQRAGRWIVSTGRSLVGSN